VPVVPWEGQGPRSTAIFYHAVLTLGLNVTTTTKKCCQLFWGGGEKCTQREKKAATRMRKGPYVGMGHPHG